MVVTLSLAAVLILLWVLPGVLFPHPSTNEAIELSALGPLLYVITLSAGGLSFVRTRLLAWKAEGPVGFGVFLLGVAAAFLLAIVTFGNASDDRCLPMFLTPVLAVPVGVLLVVAGLAMRSQSRGRPLIGAARGIAAAGVVALWLLARGAADWLHAPYGFDVYGLIAVAAETVLYLGVDARSAPGAHA